MNAPAKWCACPAPEIVTNEEKVRFCDLCGERENPIVFALGQALAGPLAELRGRMDALEAKLEIQPSPRLVDAATLGPMVGKKPAWVLRHKVELGGVPLGTGPRPRWGFDPDLAMAKLAAREDVIMTRARIEPPPRPLPAKVPLLDVKGRAA